MESRKRARRGPAPGRVAAASAVGEPFVLANIAALIDNGGQITLGAMEPLPCVAIANADYACLAMLQRRPDESVPQLLDRLDRSIAIAWATDQLIDEINPPLPKANTDRSPRG